MNRLNVHLLIIDPQNDFCDPNSGSLYVAGADKDTDRLATMLHRIGDKLGRQNIHVTLDTHHNLDIGHPIFWIGPDGNHPAPFTIITEDDLNKGVWRTTVPQFMDRARAYLNALTSNKRYPLCVWPPHCRIGTVGHNVYPSLAKELETWELKYPGFVDYVTKGSNIFTEHYSAVQADVPDPVDPSTQLNTNLITTLQDADLIAIAGQARSHCVANTITDVANNFGEDNIKKFVLLEDCTSDVTGFEALGKKFVDDMTTRGMQISNSTAFLA